MLLSLSHSALACGKTKNQEIYFEERKSHSLNIYNIYIPKKVANGNLTSAYVVYGNNGVDYLSTYADLNIPDLHESDPWFKDVLSVLVKTQEQYFKNITIEAHYTVEKNGVSSKCLSTIKFPLYHALLLQRKAFK